MLTARNAFRDNETSRTSDGRFVDLNMALLASNPMLDPIRSPAFTIGTIKRIMGC